jgi:RecA-family ATPase
MWTGMTPFAISVRVSALIRTKRSCFTIAACRNAKKGKMRLPANERMMPDFIFDREQERQRIDRFLAKRRPFLIYGPSGVGKTLLLRELCRRR